MSRRLSHATRRESAPSGTESPSVLRAAGHMPPDSNQILAVGQEQTRFPCSERAVLHKCIIQIENLLIHQMLAVTQLHIADGQLYRTAASKSLISR